MADGIAQKCCERGYVWKPGSERNDSCWEREDCFWMQANRIRYCSDCGTRLNPDGTMTRMVPSDELEQAQSELATVSAERDEAESDAIGTRDTLRDAQSDLALARRQVQVLACAFSYCRGTEADGCSTCQCAPDWENENEDWERPCDCDPEGLVAWSEQQAREQIAAEEKTYVN